MEKPIAANVVGKISKLVKMRSFTLPAGVGFYWICSSLIAGGIQTAGQYFYGPNKMLARERAKEILAVYDEEQKFISKRVVEDDSVSK